MNTGELAAWLEQQAGGDNYVVFNLSTKGRNEVDYGAFKNAVVEFQPYSRVDIIDETPSLGQLFRVIYALKFFAAWDPATLLVLHCNTGIQRTGFILAAFLAYDGVHPTMEAALAAISAARLGEGGGSVAEDFLPSWRYLMAHVDKTLRAPPSLPRVHALSHIVLALPTLRARGRPGSLPIVQLFAGPKAVFDSSADCVPEEGVRWEDDKLVVEVGGEEGLVLCGDYQLWLLLPPPRGGGGGEGEGGGAASPRTRGPGLHDLGSSSAATLDGAGEDGRPGRRNGGGGGGSAAPVE